MKCMQSGIARFIIVLALLSPSSVRAAAGAPAKTYYGDTNSWLYGWSIAPIGTNKILVGSMQDSHFSFASGAAYVMDAANSNILLSLPNPTPAQYDFFGGNVLPVGNSLLVSARWDGTNGQMAGAAYLFNGTTGALQKTFTAPAAGGFTYGSGLALVGNSILITQEEGPSGLETAYLYDSTTFNLVHTIPNIGQRCGVTTPNSYVAAAGTSFLIGRPGDNSNAGGATHYDSLTGNVIRSFSNPAVTNNDNFGFAVATLPGNRFAIAAPFADQGATNSGAVYIFNGATGALLRTLHNPNATADANFGTSIAPIGDKLLVGAPFNDLGANNAGAAYLFSIDTGALVETYLNPTPQEHDWFGQYVSSIGGDALIAAVEDNTVNSQAGAVYLYQVPEPTSLVLVGFLLRVAMMRGRRTAAGR